LPVLKIANAFQPFTALNTTILARYWSYRLM